MRISDRSIEEVREAANIVEVASEFTALRRQGARFAGLCPYPDHQEKTPSFSVSPDRGFYYCFGCLEGIELTPDHWCIFLKREEALRAISAVHLKYSGGEEIGFSRKLRGKDLGARLSIEHASGIREGDFWLYPVVPDEDRENACLWGEHVVKPYTKGPRTERITRLNVNTDTAWLYGLWLAEGSLYRGGVKWSFGADEAESLAKRTMLILEKEFGRPGCTVWLLVRTRMCE